MAQIAPLSRDALHNRFFLEKAPYWWLYQANKREVIGKFRDDDPGVVSEDEKLIYSWMQLEEIFDTIDYGYAKIVLKKSPNENNANSPTHYVRWGQTAALGSSRIGATSPAQGNEVLMERLLKMQSENHMSQMDLMKQLLETKFSNQMLEEQLEAMAEPGYQETLLKEGIGLMKSFIQRPAPQAALGTMGQDASGKYGSSATAPSGQAEGQPRSRPLDLNQVVADISVIKQSLPAYHPNDVIRALALFTQQNPQDATNYVGMLINQVNNA